MACGKDLLVVGGGWHKGGVGAVHVDLEVGRDPFDRSLSPMRLTLAWVPQRAGCPADA